MPLLDTHPLVQILSEASSFDRTPCTSSTSLRRLSTTDVIFRARLEVALVAAGISFSQAVRTEHILLC